MHRLLTQWIQLGALLAGVTAALGAQEAPKPIFRHVELVRDTLWLGRPLGSFARFARNPTDTIVTVPLGEFGGTDAIQVERGREDIVTAFTFLYGARHDMSALHAEYLSDLGAPTAQGTDSIAGVARTFWIWQDAKTEFTLAAFSAPIDGAVGAARLADRMRRAP
jgi:hypothetical protein